MTQPFRSSTLKISRACMVMGGLVMCAVQVCRVGRVYDPPTINWTIWFFIWSPLLRSLAVVLAGSNVLRLPQKRLSPAALAFGVSVSA